MTMIPLFLAVARAEDPPPPPLAEPVSPEAPPEPAEPPEDPEPGVVVVREPPPAIVAAIGPTPTFQPVRPDPVALQAESRTRMRRGAWEVGGGLVAGIGGISMVTLQQSSGANGVLRTRAVAYDAQSVAGALLIVGGFATTAIGVLDLERGVGARQRAELALGPGGVALAGDF